MKLNFCSAWFYNVFSGFSNDKYLGSQEILFYFVLLSIAKTVFGFLKYLDNFDQSCRQKEISQCYF